MNQKTKYWLSLISYLVFIVIVMYVLIMIYVYTHETVHREIYSSYGIESKIELDYFRRGGKTIVSGEDYLKCNEYCNLAHNLNEVVGYQIGMVYLLLVGIFLLLISRNYLR